MSRALLVLMFMVGCVRGGDLVIERGDLRVAFRPSIGMAMVEMRYKGGPNLINVINDNGREYQAALFEGNVRAHDPLEFWDTINPTQAGRPGMGSTAEWSYDGKYVVTALVDPLDFTNNDRMGDYRLQYLKGRWPRTGWKLKVTWSVEENGVILDSEWWHEDDTSRYVGFVEHNASLEPVMRGPFVNDHQRRLDSWCRETFNGDRVLMDGPNVRVEMVKVIGDDVKGRIWRTVWPTERPAHDFGQCNGNVNHPDMEQGQLVVLAVTLNVERWIKPGERLRVRSMLIAKAPPITTYVIPVYRLKGLVETSFIITSFNDNVCDIDIHSDDGVWRSSVFVRGTYTKTVADLFGWDEVYGLEITCNTPPAAIWGALHVIPLNSLTMFKVR